MTARCLAIVAAAVAVTGCGGSHPPTCHGGDPWTGEAGRRCVALVARWAPVHTFRLTTRIPPRVRSTCEQARRQARIPIVCPRLVPTDGVVADTGLFGAEVEEAGDFYLLTFNNGENRGHIHWIVGAGRGHSVQPALFNPRNWDVPGRVRRLGKRRYGPWTVTFYRFPPHPSGGALGGHDLALAEAGGTTYFASIDGRAYHDADAMMLIAMLLARSGNG